MKITLENWTANLSQLPTYAA